MPEPDEVVLYRVKIVERASGKVLPYGAAIFARSDIEAADALEEEFPSKRFRWYDKADGHEVTGLIAADQRTGG